MKLCTYCKVNKPLSEYTFSKIKDKKYPSSRCKPCVNQLKKERYHSDPEIKEKYLTYSREARERGSKINPEYRKEWKKKNNQKVIADKAKRRAYKLQAHAPWADPKAIEDIYKECQDLTSKTGILHHVDHIIPLKGINVCGLHVEYNLQILTASENLHKSNRYSSDN